MMHSFKVYKDIIRSVGSVTRHIMADLLLLDAIVQKIKE